MAGLVPAIHVLLAAIVRKTWMPGTRPGTTNLKGYSIDRILGHALRDLHLLASQRMAPSSGNCVSPRPAPTVLPNPPGMVTSRKAFAEDNAIMLDDALKALSQILSPPMRSIL